MSSQEFYLDHASSSRMHPKVHRALLELYEKKLGNPASIHRSGVMAMVELEKARMQIASKLNAKPEEIYFTSGATESNNLALRGLALSHRDSQRNEILISSFEHSCVKQAARDLAENYGVKVHYIKLQKSGELDWDHLNSLLGPKVLLVSVMHANNEIGTLQDLKRLGELCRLHGAFFHSDGAQAFCKTPVDTQLMNLDMYSLSSHKIHGPKGVGALYVREGLALRPQAFGGGQESGLRSGTVPVELIAAMGVATTLFNEEGLKKAQELADHFVHNLKVSLPSASLNAAGSEKLPNIFSVLLPGINGKELLKFLDQKGIRISLGSACHSGKTEPSHVLSSIGLSRHESLSTFRVSFGLETTTHEIDVLIGELKKAKEQLTTSHNQP